MKFISIFILVGLITSNAAETYSQVARFDLKMENASLKSVLKEIEEKTDFYFFYKNEEIENINNISIEAKQTSIDDVLNDLLENKDFKFEVHDRYIMIQKKGSNLSENDFLQQQKNISGKVTDSSGLPLPGVSIVVKGTTKGIISDFDGNYSLASVSSDAILVFSFVGMKAVEISIGGQEVINITMEEDAIGIEEVVAVGYGTQKKANLTGAVSTVSLESIEKTPYTNASSMLQGKVPGVYVVQGSGQPGQDVGTIRIRGVGTLNNSDPLVLIDGMQGDLNSVDPMDIENVSVLKDAASAAIYGNRAANGVILVTTKKAKRNGKLVLKYNGSYGVQSTTRLPETLGAYDHAVLFNEALANSGQAAFYSDEDVAKLKVGTEDGYKGGDWGEAFYGGSKPIQRHNLSISGGGDKLTTFLSLGYLDQEGVRYKQSYKRVNIRSNTQAYFLENDKLRIQLLLAGSKGVRDDGLFKYRNGSALDDANPTMQVKYNDPADPSKEVFGSFSGLYFSAIDAGAYAKESDFNFDGKLIAEYEMLKGLNLHFEYGNSYTLTDINEFMPYATGYYFWGDVFHAWKSSSVSRQYHKRMNETLNAYVDYELDINEKHHFKFLAGYSQEETAFDRFDAQRNNIINNYQPQLTLGDIQSSTNGSQAWEYSLRSYFGRFNYSYKDKYLLEGNIRYDGSSRFAEGNKWGVFPSFSAGWRVTEEAFMQNVDAIQNLKVRASYGQLGNQNVDNYAAANILSLGANPVFNNSQAQGAELSYLANKEISWETTTQANIGVDVAFLDDFSAEFDVYTKTSSDVLRQLPVPATTGVSSAPWRNIAEVKNTGWEFSVQYNKKLNQDWQVSASLGLSHFKNEITDMGDVGTQYVQNSILTEGQPFLAYYGLEVGGIVRTEAELNSIPEQIKTMGLGDLWYKDQNNDGKISMNDDRVIIGVPYPDLSYSLNLGVTYKGFSLSTFIQGEIGVDSYSDGPIFEPFQWNYTTGAWWKDRWTPENPNASMPKTWANRDRTLTSDFYIQDSSYLRFKDITLSYTFNKNLISRLGVSNLMIYTTARNAITITDFRGYDPERASGAKSFNSYPQVKSFTVGIQLGL